MDASQRDNRKITNILNWQIKDQEGDEIIQITNA